MVRKLKKKLVEPASALSQKSTTPKETTNFLSFKGKIILSLCIFASYMAFSRFQSDMNFNIDNRISSNFSPDENMLPYHFEAPINKEQNNTASPFDEDTRKKNLDHINKRSEGEGLAFSVAIGTFLLTCLMSKFLEFQENKPIDNKIKKINPQPNDIGESTNNSDEHKTETGTENAPLPSKIEAEVSNFIHEAKNDAYENYINDLKDSASSRDTLDDQDIDQAGEIFHNITNNTADKIEDTVHNIYQRKPINEQELGASIVKEAKKIEGIKSLICKVKSRDWFNKFVFDLLNTLAAWWQKHFGNNKKDSNNLTKTSIKPRLRLTLFKENNVTKRLKTVARIVKKKLGPSRRDLEIIDEANAEDESDSSPNLK